MFRILIVDDELIVLNGIRMMIEEDLELPFPVDVAIASNVPQAISLLEAFCPDLILTDIRMPVLDGFELICHVRKNGFSTEIVILTSHAEFEYAQKGIRFDVLDFILKPIDQQLLRNTIESVYLKKMDKEQKCLHSAMLEVRNMMLYDISAQELISAPELIKKLFPYQYFTVIVLALSKLEDAYPELFRKVLLRYYNSCYCFMVKERGQVIAICNHEQFRIRANIQQEFQDITQCENLWMGSSIGAISYKSLHSLYNNALQYIFYARHFGEGNTLTEISLFTYQDCVRIFQENDDAVVTSLLQKYVTKIRATSDIVQMPSLIYRSFIHNILLYLENNLIPISKDQINCTFSPENYQELIVIIMEQLKRIKANIQKTYEQRENHALTKRLLGYIHQHYKEDISLEDLAAHVGFHPNYVCAVFKKNIGQSFLTCLHKERVLVTKKLLLETDYTIEQIAGEVGYNSASQLARVFRKYEGVSPSSFRNGQLNTCMKY